MSKLLKVPFGKYEGESILTPTRFQLIDAEEDKNQALVVFAAMIQNLPDINFIEVEGMNQEKDGWVLAGYGLKKSPSVSQLTNIKDECNLRALVTIWWDPARESKSSYQTHRLKRAVVAVIAKQNMESQKHSHHEVKSLMRNNNHGITTHPESGRDSYSYTGSFDRPVQQNTYVSKRESSRPSNSSSSSSFSFLSDRQDKLLKSRNKPLPLSKGTTKSSKSRKVANVIKNRSMMDRALDWLLDIKHDQLEKALKGKSTDNHHRSSSSDEGVEDDDEDNFEDHRHRSRSSSQSYSSSIPSSLRTLPRDLD